MRIAVMGAGAVGGYFGGVLANQGEDVVLIARGAHGNAISENGLQVDSHWGNFNVKVNVTDDPATVGEVDLIRSVEAAGGRVRIAAHHDRLPVADGGRCRRGAQRIAQLAGVLADGRDVGGDTEDLRHIDVEVSHH